MAPPNSRRSKQNSPTSPPPPIPLPGIALGLFAAIAAGFAASRALRRKRSRSLQDEKQSIPACTPAPIPLLVEEREIEIKEKDDNFNASAILVNANGTITIAHEPSKLAAGLKPVFDAFEEVSLVQKRDAKALEEDEEKKGEEEDCGNGEREEIEKEYEFEENGKKKGETMENGEIKGEEDEIADITVKIEAYLIVDEASVEALQSVILEEKVEEEEEGALILEEKVDEEEEEDEEEALQSVILEEKVEEEEEEEEAEEGKGEVEDDGVYEDTGHDGDDDRSSTDQQPSPVLINGRILNFFEEIPDFKDDHDLLSSGGSNSLSDSFSESSMQEVNSVPVKPFVPTEETLDASWPGAKPEFFVALNQSGQENAFSEDKNWSDNEKNLLPLEGGLPEMKKKVPEFVENLSQTDQNFIELKHDWAMSNDDVLHLIPSEHDIDVGLLNLKPVLVEIEEKESSVDKINQIKFEILSDVADAKGDSIALEGKVSIKVNGLDEGIAESTINGKVLFNGSSLPEELDDLESIGEGEHVLQSTREISDDFTGITCKGEKIVEPVRINSKVLLDESLNGLSIPEFMTADETGSQTGQEGADGTISDAHGEPDLLAAMELLDDKTCVSSEGELYDDESTQEVACVGIDASEKLVIVEGILEEPVPQPAAQKLDTVDGASAESNVNVDEEQSSSFTASKGITEGNELSCEGSADNFELGSGREDINDVLSEQTPVEGRIYEKEQEIEEITRSCDPNDLIFETKKLASLADSALVSHNDTREVDYSSSAHHHGLQLKGGFASKVLQYLPLEIGFICSLIAALSFVLWYLEVSRSILP